MEDNEEVADLVHWSIWCLRQREVKPSAREYARVIHKNRLFRSRIDSFIRSASRVGSLATRRRTKKKSNSIRFQWHRCSMYLYEYIDIPWEHFQLSKPNKYQWSVDLFHSSLVKNPLEIFRSMLSMDDWACERPTSGLLLLFGEGKRAAAIEKIGIWDRRQYDFLFAKATKINTKMMKSSLRKIVFSFVRSTSLCPMIHPWVRFPLFSRLSASIYYFNRNIIFFFINQSPERSKDVAPLSSIRFCSSYSRKMSAESDSSIWIHWNALLEKEKMNNVDQPYVLSVENTIENEDVYWFMRLILNEFSKVISHRALLSSWDAKVHGPCQSSSMHQLSLELSI